MADGSVVRSAEPSWVPPETAVDVLTVQVHGMTSDAHAILKDYAGDLPAFLNDCTSPCHACGSRWFTGYGCMEAELDGDGRFTCRPCERRLTVERTGSIYDSGRA